MGITFHNAKLWDRDAEWDEATKCTIVMANDVLEDPNSNILVAFKHSGIERAFWENKFWDAYWGPFNETDCPGFTCVILKLNTSEELREAYGAISNIRQSS